VVDILRHQVQPGVPLLPLLLFPVLLLANIVVGKGDRAGRHTLVQLGATREAADAILHHPAMQAVVEAIRAFYKHLLVCATMSFQTVPLPQGACGHVSTQPGMQVPEDYVQRISALMPGGAQFAGSSEAALVVVLEFLLNDGAPLAFECSHACDGKHQAHPCRWLCQQATS
jgi:hypothetical protein